MSALAKIYADLIKSGDRKLENVKPESLRKEVQKILEGK